MPCEQPLYIMIKPPLPIARDIDCCRRVLDVDGRYGMERFHVTVLPIGEGRDIATAQLERLRDAIASLQAEPFRIAFDTLNRNALVGRDARALRAFRKSVVQRMAASGLPLPRYNARPHLSLAYGAAPDRNIAIEPIAWLVEEFQLIRSIRGEGRHEMLARFPLVSRQRSFDF